MQTTALTLRNDIQGLRALAVLAVIVFHMNSNWLPGGFLGVDIFFVISGFIITRLLHTQHTAQTFSYRQFYLSRAKRIIPAYLALIVICSLVFALLLIKGDFRDFFRSAKAALIFNSNNYFAHYYDYFGPKAFELPLLHTWSLAIEMQYYLLMPVLFLMLPAKWRTPVLVALFAGLTGYATYRGTQPDASGLYYSLAARIPEFLIGSVTALIRPPASATQQRVAYAVGGSLMVASFALITESAFKPGLLTLPPCIGVALVIWAAINQRSNPLCNPIAVQTGNLSYSLYLWHWPILAALRYIHGSYELPASVLSAAALLTLICGWLSYTFIENRVRFSKARSIPLGATIAILVIALGTLQATRKLNKTVVPRPPVEFTRYADPALICHGQIIGDCVRGAQDAPQEILVIGDSHAAQLNLFADVVGRYINARMRVISASSCIPLHGFDIRSVPQNAVAPCEAQIQQVDKYLATAKTVFIAGRWDLHLKDPASANSIDHLFEQSARRDQQVFVLLQIPSLTADLQRATRLKALGLHPRVTVDDKWRLANDRIIEMASKYDNVQVLDFTGIDLWRDAPFDGATPLYSDADHLNETGATRYGEAVKEQLRAALKWTSRPLEAPAAIASQPPAAGQ
ncbi:acyltransferase family protein [Pseudomonas sichuanensis]|uniref:acyltransferase family protein n=1 Tax=Pseudomonas sichuanensis TaxID=2213015 RepID=UPI0013005C06|nr:acyltransferase family protein [Pseudomonas sichuanensis]